jgi:hypothetical protein
MLITTEPSIKDTELNRLTVMVAGSYDPVGAFSCIGGFGCSPNSPGGKVYGQFIASGDETFVRRGWITGLATEADTSHAGHWASQPRWVINLAIAKRMRSVTNDKVNELSRDDGGRMSKDTIRVMVLELQSCINSLCDMMQEVSDDYAQEELPNGIDK